MDFKIVLFWMASFLSLLGAWWVGKEETKGKGFSCWMISNPVLAYSSFTTGSYYMVIMFIVFFVFAIRGFINE